MFIQFSACAINITLSDTQRGLVSQLANAVNATGVFDFLNRLLNGTVVSYNNATGLLCLTVNTGIIDQLTNNTFIYPIIESIFAGVDLSVIDGILSGTNPISGAIGGLTG